MQACPSRRSKAYSGSDMKLLFCHDHVFSFYRGNYYSPGKLDYKKFDVYLEKFSHITCIARARQVESIDNNYHQANGNLVDIVGLENPSSLWGLLNRRVLKRVIRDHIRKVDAVIVRLPSEIGIIAAQLAQEEGKPLLAEVVASAFDCLWYRGDILAKIYAPFLELRTAHVCETIPLLTYVTSNFLQSKYATQGCSYAISDVIINEVLLPRRWINKSSFTVGMIGNPDLKIKGLVTLIEAIQQIRSKGVDVNLEVLGGNGHGYMLRNGDVPGWVTFLGTFSNPGKVIGWLDQIDFYVQPSLTEGLPRSLIEAMSRGMPALGSNVGGIPELLLEAALFAPCDSKQLANSLFKAMVCPTHYDELAKHSSETANKFNSKVLLQSRLDVLDKLSSLV